jgi:hypothetical protein
MTVTSVQSCTDSVVAVAIPTQRTVANTLQPRAVADLTLAATSTAVNVGRMFVHHTLNEWGQPGLVSTGEALLSELVDQAVTLTGVPDPSTRWLDLDDLALIDLRLLLFDHGIVIEVGDRHRDAPTPSTHFRSLSTRWHFYPTPAGRVVWCELALIPYELTEQGLPKRKRSPDLPTRRSPGPAVDRDLLRRVLDGLEGL